MEYILIALFGYLLGSFSPAYIMGRITKKIDIRQYGSGNAGATNVNRVLGIKAAIIVFIFDILKGVVAVMVGRELGQQPGAMLGGLAAVIGHNWPIFLGFRGGKGIATSIGIIAMLFPAEFALLFIIAIIIVYYSQYVSLGSIVLAILLPISLIVFNHPFFHVIWGFFMGGMAVLRHRSNIIRLFAGTESKISI